MEIIIEISLIKKIKAIRVNTTKLILKIIFEQYIYIVDNTSKKFSFFLFYFKTFDLDYTLACIHCIQSNSKTDVIQQDKAQPSNSVKSLDCDSSRLLKLQKFSLLIAATSYKTVYWEINAILHFTQK